MLLNIKIERMEMHNEEVIDLDHDAKGIRLDVFVKDTGKMYDIEMQTANTDDLQKRSRYYQALMDLDTLKAGQEYKELKDSHVIFICLDDIFKRGLPVDTFDYTCQEDGKTKLYDGALKHFFIAKSCAKMIDDKEARSFFNFLISNKATSDYTSDLNKYVTDAKHNMQWRVQYMTWERQQTYAFNAGQEKGIAIGEKKNALESAKNFLKMNVLTPEQIAQGTGLTVDEVKQLAAEVFA